MSILDNLKNIVGSKNVLTDDDSLSHYGKDWTTIYMVDPVAIVFPNTTEEVQAIVQLANRENIALVPSGGRTGLSGGAVASNKEVVVSFERMNKVLEFDSINRSVHCQAGVITQQLQNLADENGLFYPVDFASSGSSQIGGNIATNAGGIKVVGYGLTRNWVLGLTVVTGAGEILHLNHGLIKNATGYDLRHLFIGSEGTLGFIAEATIQLTRKPQNLNVMVLGVNTIADIMKVFERFQSEIDITAFEFFSQRCLDYLHKDKGLAKPLEQDTPFYALIEFENSSEQHEETALQAFEDCMESGWVLDGVMSQNIQQARDLWRLREDISETISAYSPYKNDLSVCVSKVPEYLDGVNKIVRDHYSDFEVLWYGHIGDGNLHLNILKPESLTNDTFKKICSAVSEKIFELTQSMQGSVSAEHGVGIFKRDALHYSRSDEEIQAMCAIKKVFDPNGVMNPGKLLKE